MVKRLGELLQDKKLIEARGVEEALRISKQTGEKLGQVLVEQGAVSAEDVMATLGEQLGIKTVALLNYAINPDVGKLVPRDVCEKYLCVPLEIGPHNTLEVALSDPVSHDVVQQLTFITGKQIQSCLATEADIRKTINRIYDFGVSLDELIANVESNADVELVDPKADEKDGYRRGEAVIQIVKAVLGDAVRKGASDIHMEPSPNLFRIRVRIDGELRNLINVPKWLQAQVTACVKVQASMDIAEKRVPQDGKLSALISGRQIDFRVSTLPTPHGEKVVIRVMDKGGKRNALDRIGLPAPLLAQAKSLLQNHKGVILLTGPTGSGKTTLLYAMLGERLLAGGNIITVEDPIEYEFEGITQTQINEKAGLTFPNILRSILRQDPNVIMIGEIRDQQTAGIAFRAAQTGHLVLSTLHTNSAAASVARLVDLGIDPHMISSTVLGVFAQRLVRQNCPDCAKEDASSDTFHAQYFRRLLPPDAKMRHGIGCNACENTGYRGRVGVYELLRFTPAVVDAVNAGVPEDQLLKTAKDDGMLTLVDECVRLIGAGVTSVSECAGIVTGLESKEGGRTADKCPSCNAPISSDFVACPYCQYMLASSCPKCKSPIEQDWRACPHCMTLLKTAQPAPAPGVAPVSRANAADKPRVLVADDEVALRKAVNIILGQIGCEVIEASDGGDALRKIEIHRPDLVIADINMPVMDGYELCKRVRKNMGTAFIPFIMLTSRHDAEDKLKGFMHGTDDYITKPFNYRELQARVKRLLARNALAPAA